MIADTRRIFVRLPRIRCTLLNTPGFWSTRWYPTRPGGNQLASNTHLGTPFHTDSLLRRDCDWGRPCQCVDCREEAEQRENERREAARVPICQVCETSPTAHVSFGDPVWAIGRTGYTSFCAECWKKAAEKNKEIEERRERKEQQRMKSIKGMSKACFRE
ncbi:hypothetical protein CB0940_01522 [Cercospora beticola]|uniref:Uncharacterized protein n=1 Tax=Cercospora beticola TaxID=122368 RepID=A0A2G5IAT1_CERBT|nr:hypothetical protein CB0940_01522 [Cercospora beticola]PIB01947.1 hypothetical protein CB0940_01522 [Cercospora beticola]